MLTYAPRWALTAQALDSAGSSHLPPGVHLRVVPSPLLGLPVMPFMVYRLLLGPGAARGTQLRSDITWIDSRGNTLTVPFQVTADNPVTGYLPPPSQGICCWIQVDAVPDRIVIQPPTRPPVTPPITPPIRGPVTAPVGPVGGLKLQPPLALDPGLLLPLRGYMKVDATASSPKGPGVVASTVRSPYQLAASRIEQVVVTGKGTVNGVHWVDARRLQEGWQPWRLLGLPVPFGARYAGIPNADVVAKQRVDQGAPLRFGLHDRPDAASPAACPPATPADEQNRLAPLEGDVLPYVKRLVDDLSLPPWLLTDEQQLMQDGKAVGAAHINLLGTVLQAGLDPGMGRWLGFVDRDEAPLSTTAGIVVAYAIRGIWSADPDLLKPYWETLPREWLLEQLPHFAFGDLKMPYKDPPAVKGPFLDLWTIACATIGNPPDAPAPPLLDDPVNAEWLPAVPPAAKREVILPVHGLVQGATVALARKVGSAITGLNRKSSAGRAISLALAAPQDATDPSQGTFSDRNAPPDGFAFRAAQADWFGRWSGWSEKNAAGKARPLPPVPVLAPSYMQPAVPSPIPSTPMKGQLKVRVTVPKPAALAPGSFLLTTLEIVVDGVITSIPIGTPAAPPDYLEALIDGPAIARAAMQTVHLKARWLDAGGQTGAYSDETALDLYDPRPPEQVSLPATLSYGSRPDVTGYSRITLRWTPAPSQKHFRIFYADETGITSRLEYISKNNADPRHTQAASILADLAGKAAPDRATVFRNNATFLDRAWFELLTGDPLPNTGGTMSFEHKVSGSLRVLCFYRIVTVSAAQAESDFGTAPLAVYGVPNTGAPTQPLVEVKPAAGPLHVDITVKVPRGQVLAQKYRLRRSSTKVLDPMQMPIVHTGTVPPVSGDKPQEATYSDLGAWDDVAPANALRGWTTYYYVAQVQGAPEPGSTLEGKWSDASPVAVAMMVPPNAPAKPDSIAVSVLDMSAHLRFHHAERLTGGAMGQYTIDIYKQLPGEQEQFLTSLNGGAQDGAGWFDCYDLDAHPAGTQYRVIITDPLGRTSPPSDAVALS